MVLCARLAWLLIWGLPDKLLGVAHFAEVYLLRDLVKDNG